MQVPLLRLDEDHGCADEDGEDDSDDDDEVYEQNNNRTPKLKKGSNIIVPFFKVVKCIHCDVN